MIDDNIFYDIKALKKIGFRIAILSNSSHLMSEVYKKNKLYACADKVFLSNELGMIKPRPKTFKYVTDELNSSPKECLLIDDSWYNVLFATFMRWKVIWFANHNDLKKIFKKMKRPARNF